MSCLTLRKSLSVACAYSWFTTHGRLISVSKRPSFVPLKIADGQKYFLCHTHVTLVNDKAKTKKKSTRTRQQLDSIGDHTYRDMSWDLRCVNIYPTVAWFTSQNPIRETSSIKGLREWLCRFHSRSAVTLFPLGSLHIKHGVSPFGFAWSRQNCCPYSNFPRRHQLAGPAAVIPLWAARTLAAGSHLQACLSSQFPSMRS